VSKVKTTVFSKARLSRFISAFRDEAAVYANDREKLSGLLRAATNYARAHGASIQACKSDLRDLVDLVRSWLSGEYRGVSKKTIILAVAALLYFLSPIDVIPDFLAPLGFTDDIAAIALVIRAIKSDIDRFTEWRSGVAL
jgi:uncharacterized membrane protein YkvA (DUF1232 family)